MVSLRERLGMRSEEERQEDAAAEVEFERLIRQEFERVEYETQLDEVLPADLKTRNSADTLERGVDRLSNAYLHAIRKCYEQTGLTPAELDNISYANRIEERDDEVTLSYDALVVATDRQRWLDDMRGDLEGNFVYEEYLSQLFSDRPVAESYAYYSAFLAVMAVIRYIAEYPDAIEAFNLESSTRSITGPTGQTQEYRYCEMRDQAVWFLDEMRVGHILTTDIFNFLATAEYHIPGVQKIADSVLKTYSDTVRVERDRLEEQQLRVLDTPLPDEDPALTPDALRKIKNIYNDMRFDRALAAYQSDTTGRAIKEIAREYGVDNEKLRKEIKRLGITRSWGGDRKAKKSA